MKLTTEQKYNRRCKVNQTARQRTGASIRSLDRLSELAGKRKSVFYAGCWGLLPAVAVMNMPATLVHRAIVSGGLFEYSPNDQAKRHDD